MSELVKLIAAELARNDACGPGPVSEREYLDDARAILRIVREHDTALRLFEVQGVFAAVLVRAGSPEQAVELVQALPRQEAFGRFRQSFSKSPELVEPVDDPGGACVLRTWME